MKLKDIFKTKEKLNTRELHNWIIVSHAWFLHDIGFKRKFVDNVTEYEINLLAQTFKNEQEQAFKHVAVTYIRLT